jgi:hypothetical protein
MPGTFGSGCSSTVHWNVYATINAGCISPAGNEANQIYNQNSHTWQFCNGTNWIAFGGDMWQGNKPSGTGYFVMSKSTWTGNLGGSLTAADALCLTELTTNTGWKGYADANARGILVSGHVHAFLCDAEGYGGVNWWGACNIPQDNTTFYFADANNSAHGGNLFTTDSNGVGPNDFANWSATSYFGGTYSYWTNRGPGTATAWATTPAYTGSSCTDVWNSGSGSNNGKVGTTPNTDNTRWLNVFLWACNNTFNLICFVNP